MKKNKIALLIYETLIVLLFSVGFAQYASAQICITSSSSSDQIRATDASGYTHELWNNKKQGQACMTLYSSGAFDATWGSSSGNIDNYLARRGIGFDDYATNRLTPAQRGIFKASYTVDYQPNCSVGGNSYMGIYGWARDFTAEASSSPGSEQHIRSLVEFYVIENWCNWIPSMASTAKYAGKYFSDGSIYEVYEDQRFDAGSIRVNTSLGEADSFTQYFSIRQNKRTNGDINVSNHFQAWEGLLGPMGSLYEVSMLVEGYQNRGTAKFSNLKITADLPKPSLLDFADHHMVVDTYCAIPGWIKPAITFTGDTSLLSSINISSSNGNAQVESSGATHLLVGASQTQSGGPPPGTDTLVLYAPEATYGPGVIWDAASATVLFRPICPDGTDPRAARRAYEFGAQGTQGYEKLNVTLDGAPIKSHLITTTMETYSGVFYGEGNVSVEFVNDDINNARDVRLDYLTVDGVRRETEAMSINTAAYGNGHCGGGAYTEWLNCNGVVNFGKFDRNHTITIRARGNSGGEHIKLLINGKAVNNGWWLGTNFQEHTASVVGDGDISVAFDNDGGLKDVVVDWVKVDNQFPRQAENMRYNTSTFANGRCGGGGYSEWLHCNGAIGFGKISDKFD